MEKTRNSKQYDLEDRTLLFEKNVRSFIRKLKGDIANNEDIKQLVRSSGSVGENYIEANESLGKKDFAMRIKISRKEAKERRYWLQLLLVEDNKNLSKNRDELVQEATELMLIFGSILQKASS